ncbi:hypothetical protein OJ997_33810 [Solirubrobacter phytolaccae]|uniref:Uncharacterized protein n=1 Tax=Solirubrobacter phytolaccae TaxID=1404360 RepID=A0A9X3SD23_9ACTN|nr:hypothetical protein [Solirubrobacter phytolaccae]MDA0185331.1 hypothetical protein [Solirubrobacter phytolaccae]
MRRLLVVLALALVCAPAAQAAPRPLTKLAPDEGFALAGDRVLFTQSAGRRVTVRSIPVAGGPARTIASFTVREPVDSVELSAQGDRAAAVVLMRRPEDTYSSQLFAGGLDGGWSAASPWAKFWTGGSLPVGVQVDSGLLFTQEAREDMTDVTAVVRDPAARDLPYRSFHTRFAGDLVAYTTQTLETSREVMVANWRTGAELGRTTLPSPAAQIALAADGRVVATDEAGSAYAFTAGQPAQRLGPADGRLVALAGAHVAAAHAGRLWLAPPGGALQPFGVRTKGLGRLTGDAQHVLWQANGCLLVAALGDAPVNEPGPGPCARSEVELIGTGDLGRRTRLTLRCVASPRTGCRGSVRLYADARAVGRKTAFRIPARGTRAVTLALSTRDLARLERAESIGVDTGAGVEYPGAG